jgi:hypothetical protein
LWLVMRIATGRVQQLLLLLALLMPSVRDQLQLQAAAAVVGRGYDGTRPRSIESAVVVAAAAVAELAAAKAAAAAAEEEEGCHGDELFGACLVG